MKVMAESDELRPPGVSLATGDVDDTLDRVAAACEFSSSDLRQRHRNIHAPNPSDLLADMFRCMSAQGFETGSHYRDVNLAIGPPCSSLRTPRAQIVLWSPCIHPSRRMLAQKGAERNAATAFKQAEQSGQVLSALRPSRN